MENQLIIAVNSNTFSCLKKNEIITTAVARYLQKKQKTKTSVTSDDEPSRKKRKRRNFLYDADQSDEEEIEIGLVEESDQERVVSADESLSESENSDLD